VIYRPSPLAAILLGLALSSVACVASPIRGTAQPTGAPAVALVAAAGAETVPAGGLCPSGPGVRVVECTVFPLFPADAGQCADNQTKTGAEPACMLPRPGSDLDMAWTITDVPSGSPRRSLTLFRGTSALTAVARATDPDGSRWLAVTVCPRDIDGDGLLDAVVTFRVTDDPGRLWIDVVRLNEPTPQLLSMPGQRALLSDGQGCEAKTVKRLAYDQDNKRLKLNPAT
jgi:hypothetical protein